MMKQMSQTEPKGIDLVDLNRWDIVVDDDAVAGELYAAEEFQEFFRQATGVKLPIVCNIDRRDRHIFIGPGRHLKESDIGFGGGVDDFGEEDFRIVVRDGNMAFAGGRPRGTLYGVYAFLEDCLGVRFLTADHTHVPKIDGACIVGPVDRSYHPPLEFRWSYYHETNNNEAFATRLRVNTVTENPRLGGKTGISLVNHSWSGQCPVSKYGREHPEYFALVDGKRKLDSGGGGPQLCLTNPDVLKTVTESVLRELEGNPSAKNISVSPMDNEDYCRCADCAAIDKREGTSMGSLLTFVNAVADAVVGRFPAVSVGTLAYGYSRQRPKTVTPRPNVQIQLCSIECCPVHLIADPDCPRNAAFSRDMTDWGEVCDNIYIWNYNTNFANYLLPCPNLRVIEPNIRHFVSNHARGIFMQAATPTPAGELSDLRNYMMANLLWDPNRSGPMLMNEFLELHYGPAAAPIRRFIDLTHDRAEAAFPHPHTNHYPHWGGPASFYGVDESIAQAGLEAFDEAMKLSDNDVVRGRVEKASICAYRAAIEPVWYVGNPQRKEENQPAWWPDIWVDGPADPALAQRMRPLVEQFLKLCSKYDVTQDFEGHPLDAAGSRIRWAVGL